MIRRILSIVVISLLLASCATYTIGEGKANLDMPPAITEPETRYRIIKERKEAEEKAREEAERLQRDEEARLAAEKAEQERLEEERKAQELAEYLANAVYEYPEDLAELTIPHNYRPKREHLSIETEKTPVKLLFIPLCPDADINKIISSTTSLDADFTFLTGEKEQLVEYSMKAGKDTVLLEGGAILYNTVLKDIDADSAIFTLNEEKDIELSVANFYAGLPSYGSEMSIWAEEGDGDIEEIEKIALKDSEIVFALSSSQPSNQDWEGFTPYSYRKETGFENSTYFEENGYDDLYRITHYPSETKPGNTRKSGEVEERMDFLYIKGVLPVSSTTIDVAGMENRCIYGEILIP